MTEKDIWCWICCETELFANDNCLNIIFKKFIQGEEPGEFCETCQKEGGDGKD